MTAETWNPLKPWKAKGYGNYSAAHECELEILLREVGTRDGIQNEENGDDDDASGLSSSLVLGRDPAERQTTRESEREADMNVELWIGDHGRRRCNRVEMMLRWSKNIILYLYYIYIYIYIIPFIFTLIKCSNVENVCMFILYVIGINLTKLIYIFYS